MTARFIVGDAFEAMAAMPDRSVDLILTSPPFLQLRSYLPDGHRDKAREIGSEAAPADFIDVLLKWTAECRRVLTPLGSLAVELGDPYSGSSGSGGDYSPGGLRDGQPTVRPRHGDGWPMGKSLAMVPEAYRLGLAYGFNPLNGAPSPAGRFRIRNVLRWCRPNPSIGEDTDKYRPATTDIMVACTARDRWWDLHDVRTQETAGGPQQAKLMEEAGDPNVLAAPPLDWWMIPTARYSGAHYAVWPSQLCSLLIRSMCPRAVCRECGEPRRRILSDPKYRDNRRREPVHGLVYPNPKVRAAKDPYAKTVQESLGWTDCGHDDYRPGVVLDPFAGTGTTLAAAQGHGRDAIGIDLDERNIEFAERRVGTMFLTVERHNQRKETV